MRVLVALGTRPEIIKLAPVVAELRATGFAVEVLATGQHDDPSLSDVFFAGLGLTPDTRWQLEGGEGRRVGTILTRSFELLEERRPDLVLLLGDTYTVPLFGLTARRLRIPVVHLEAGLRSCNPASAEEVHRRVAGVLASLHLAPTPRAARFLRDEGVDEERVKVVGNPIIDVLRLAGVARRALDERRGAVLTAHRATNVDDAQRLEALVQLTDRLACALSEVSFPVHPRTRARLEAAGALARLERRGIRLLPPLSWTAMTELLSGCRVAITDSGGLQEEASYLGVPVVVLRRSTPRWEGVEARTSVLTGMDVERAVAAARHLATDDEQARVAAAPCPYGDGHTAERVAAILADPATARLLDVSEPDFVCGPIP